MRKKKAERLSVEDIRFGILSDLPPTRSGRQREKWKMVTSGGQLGAPR
jgi:hypothetical protein